jgi:hypothetical protein
MTEVQHGEDHPDHDFQIQIDRVHYTVEKADLTGQELRDVPTPPVGPDRDLFEVVPGHPDRKIENDKEVEIKNGLRFFTAPAHINPGRCQAPSDRRSTDDASAN